MQDGFIFSDSIERNIAVGDDYPDKTKLQHAIHGANIGEFIDSLPLGLKNKIGAEGNGISQGQRQRLLNCPCCI
jgi:ATP-binding cassette subfamily B protein